MLLHATSLTQSPIYYWVIWTPWLCAIEGFILVCLILSRIFLLDRRGAEVMCVMSPYWDTANRRRMSPWEARTLSRMLGNIGSCAIRGRRLSNPTAGDVPPAASPPIPRHNNICAHTHLQSREWFQCLFYIQVYRASKEDHYLVGCILKQLLTINLNGKKGLERSHF